MNKMVGTREPLNQDNMVETKEGNLILDSHKLPFHFDRVEAWENGEKIPPVTVDMALTRACSAMCSFCYAIMQEPQERRSIKEKDALNLLDDFYEIGVKGVSLISDGESTLSKAYVPFVQHAAELGINVGNATNGWEWEPDKIDEVLPHMTWIRFTVAAGTPEGYSRIMFKGPEHTHVFDRATEHIKYAVELKKRKKETFAVIIGFITGSLGVVWPWKEKVFKTNALGENLIDREGNKIIDNYDRYWPVFDSLETWLAIFFIFFGILIVLGLAWYENRNQHT